MLALLPSCLVCTNHVTVLCSPAQRADCKTISNKCERATSKQFSVLHECASNVTASVSQIGMAIQNVSCSNGRQLDALALKLLWNGKRAQATGVGGKAAVMGVVEAPVGIAGNILNAISRHQHAESLPSGILPFGSLARQLETPRSCPAAKPSPAPLRGGLPLRRRRTTGEVALRPSGILECPGDKEEEPQVRKLTLIKQMEEDFEKMQYHEGWFFMSDGKPARFDWDMNTTYDPTNDEVKNFKYRTTLVTRYEGEEIIWKSTRVLRMCRRVERK